MCKKSVIPLIILLSFLFIGTFTCIEDARSQNFSIDIPTVASTVIRPSSTIVVSDPDIRLVSPTIVAPTLISPIIVSPDPVIVKARNQFNEGLAKVSKTQVNTIVGNLPVTLETGSFVMADAVDDANGVIASLLPIIPVFSGNTYYEELMDIGLYPEKDLLTAVIAIKQQSGYGGNLCEYGNPEYVTFWIDWNHDNSYTNSELIGISNMNAHDIANELRCSYCNNGYIYYSVSLKIPKAVKKWCNRPNLVHVRAILSYGIPHLNPNTLPYYGNVMNRWVQIHPLYWLIYPNITIPELQKIPPDPLSPILEIPPILEWKIPPSPDPLPSLPEWEIFSGLLQPIYSGIAASTEPLSAELEPTLSELSEAGLVDSSDFAVSSAISPVSVPYNGLNTAEEPIEEEEVPIAELKTLYQDYGVENGRVEYQSIIAQFSQKNTAGTRVSYSPAALLSYATADEATGTTAANLSVIPLANPAEFVKSSLVAKYPELKTLGNTKYEELTYFGLDTDNSTMRAIIHIKNPYGYKGGLCSKGSREYVRFWIDWDCDGFDASDNVGATYVKVHDIPTIPAEGLYYAVVHKFAPKYSRSCYQKNVYRARAILSWDVCPSLNPSFSYHWGNAKNACVQVKPDDSWIEGIYPFIDTIGRVQKDSINANGFANGQCGSVTAVNAPFGGYITITGHIFNIPDFSKNSNTTIEYSPTVRYKFQYKRPADTQWTDMLPSSSGNKFWISVTKFNHQAVNQEIITKNILNTADDNGFYSYYEDLKYTETYPITQFVAENKLMQWNTTGLADGKYQIRMVVKDNTNYIYSDDFKVINVALDNTLPYVHLTFDAGIGVCGKIAQGTPIEGIHTVYDQHIYYYDLWSSCGASCNGGGTITHGTSNVTNEPFSQDTTGFDSCGYSVSLRAYDRTIYNDYFGNRYNYTSEYFCLLNPEDDCTEGCEGVTIYYQDADGDSYGNDSVSIRAGSAPAGYVTDNTDFDDEDRSVHSRSGDSYSGKVPSGKVTVAEEIKGKVGATIQVPISIQSTSKGIYTLGFEVTFDPSVLKFSGFKKADRGVLVENFDMVEVSVVNTSRLRIGAYDAGSGISAGNSGELVRLRFEVIGGQEDECYPIHIEELIDDMADFSSASGCFSIKHCNGDVNEDGNVTPADALIIFKCYLGSGDCPDCADVNEDGTVTPADALCAFNRYLGKPSCLDEVK